MPEPTWIALDAGTTGATALLFAADLRPIARAYRELPQRFPRPGWVEHLAEDVLGTADAVLAEIARHPRAADAAGLGLTNQRETVFACDRRTGRALAPGIVWQDRRTAARCAELKELGLEDLVRKRTGLVIDPYFSATKIEWLLREVDGIAARAAAGDVVFATVDALLARHLTGAWATEPTNAARTMLFDVDARAYDPELCERFGVDPAWLPEVRPSVSDFGPARIEGRAPLPLLGIAGDQQAALFGQGCVEPGGFKVTFGTGCFLLLNTGERRVDSARGLLTTLAVDARGEPCYAIEGSVFVAGALVQWLRDQLGLIRRSDEIEDLAREVQDSGGATIVPAFAGLGAPHWDPGARGAILGLTRGTTRAHLARAALEAIALQNAELIDVLRAESGLPIPELLADGGAAANDLLLQMQADLSGCVVRRPSDVEATARGAAALAALRQGPPAAAEGGGGATFRPALGDAERAAALERWSAAVARVRSA